jgi:hypothetical protein
MESDRKEFLIQMYNQMFNDINRHILVVWQSIGTLVGAFALLALVEKSVLSVDVAVALIILLTAWLFAHLLDAGYWYNRNLVIIANIERQFLMSDDLRKIQYYFGAHRPKNRMLTHLKIQGALGIGLVLLMLIYHATERVVPGLSMALTAFEASRTLPYVTLVVCLLYLHNLRKSRDADYQEFVTNSPGETVDTAGIAFGPGHGHDRLKDQK